MAGEVSRRDGRVLSAPVFSEESKNAMAEAIAKAMVQMAKPEIRRTVLQYMKKEA